MSSRSKCIFLAHYAMPMSKIMFPDLPLNLTRKLQIKLQIIPSNENLYNPQQSTINKNVITKSNIIDDNFNFGEDDDDGVKDQDFDSSSSRTSLSSSSSNEEVIVVEEE